MKSVYILKLEGGFYYVGITNKDVPARFQEHLNGYGSEWTKLHKPIKILEIVSQADPFDEDKYTKIYMSKYGIDKVRGGSYVTIKLPEFKIKSLEAELNTTNRTCFVCSSPYHYAKTCPENNVKTYKRKNRTFCTRCGRKSHKIDECYAKSNINGDVITPYQNNICLESKAVYPKKTKRNRNDMGECLIS